MDSNTLSCSLSVHKPVPPYYTILGKVYNNSNAVGEEETVYSLVRPPLPSNDTKIDNNSINNPGSRASGLKRIMRSDPHDTYNDTTIDTTLELEMHLYTVRVPDPTVPYIGTRQLLPALSRLIHRHIDNNKRTKNNYRPITRDDPPCRRTLQRLLAVTALELRCAICLEIPTGVAAPPYALPCGHGYCQPCITKALSSRPCCPLCGHGTGHRGGVAVGALGRVADVIRGIGKDMGVVDIGEDDSNLGDSNNVLVGGDDVGSERNILFDNRTSDTSVLTQKLDGRHSNNIYPYGEENLTAYNRDDDDSNMTLQALDDSSDNIYKNDIDDISITPVVEGEGHYSIEQQSCHYGVGSSSYYLLNNYNDNNINNISEICGSVVQARKLLSHVIRQCVGQHMEYVNNNIINSGSNFPQFTIDECDRLLNMSHEELMEIMEFPNGKEVTIS